MPVTRPNFVKGSIYIMQNLQGASLRDLHRIPPTDKTENLSLAPGPPHCAPGTSEQLRFSRLDPTHCFFGLVDVFFFYFGQCCREPSSGTNFPELGMISVIRAPGINEIKQTFQVLKGL